MDELCLSCNVIFRFTTRKVERSFHIEKCLVWNQCTVATVTAGRHGNSYFQNSRQALHCELHRTVLRLNGTCGKEVVLCIISLRLSFIVEGDVLDIRVLIIFLDGEERRILGACL